MNRPVINVDMDGVIYNFTDRIRELVQAAADRPLTPVEQWEIWKQWGVPEGLFNRVFRQGVNTGALWKTGEVVPGAVEGLWALSDAEYHLRLLTNRLNIRFEHDVAVISTATWLREHNVPYRSLSVIGYGEPKSNYRAELLIDDNLDNVNEWVWTTVRPAILLDSPWNQGHATTGVHRVAGWPEIVETVKWLVPNASS